MQPNWVSALLASPEIGRQAGQSDESRGHVASVAGLLLVWVPLLSGREREEGPSGWQKCGRRERNGSVPSLPTQYVVERGGHNTRRQRGGGCTCSLCSTVPRVHSWSRSASTESNTRYSAQHFLILVCVRACVRVWHAYNEWRT